MLMPGRTYSADGSYKYGFNGKENDNDVKGEGNQQDYGMRIYDPRLGKFLSVDPLTKGYPMLTPYQFASNSPIVNIDLDGMEGTRHKININDNTILEVANLKIYVNVTNNAKYANGIFAGNAYENQNKIVNEFHTYLDQIYNGGKDIFDIMLNPITVNETGTPTFYRFEVVPIQASNENEYLANRDKIINPGPYKVNSIPDGKEIEENGKVEFEGNDFAFLQFGKVKDGVAMYNQNNEIILEKSRYENRAANLFDFMSDISHEVGHKLLSRHQDKTVRNPGASSFLHNRIGGIMTYNFIRKVGGVEFSMNEPSATASQHNTDLFLESLIKVKHTSVIFKKEYIPQ